MKRTILYPALLVLLGLAAVGYSEADKKSSKDKKSAGKDEAGQLVWYRYDQGLKKAKSEKKPILVDFYTDWCGWCKKMDKDTYGNQEVMKLLNEKFIIVKINAESKNPLEIKDDQGKQKTEAQIAREFNVSAFPITWFLRPTGEQITYVPGYYPADNFVPVLTMVSDYIKEKAYEKMSINDYVKQKENSKTKKN
ncbi:MAG: hypothetical protein A2145_00705 [candidate division Zixibacteria bacterium RBG_16_40_9]|nr:MAG: hypothetical protein A2145_00705 [candidate division Zixibacteria bacterium RBG_16_40_9]